MADTHGIVYTPQPIVDFMVKSVAAILKREFGRSLADEGVHIIDPFVGTGNFIVRMMREIPRTALERKYKGELHCNEVMLLPYYIASMNIEHEYFDATGVYKPFEGICLMDTFDLAEDRQLPLFAPENTQRAEEQKRTPMFVVIGNPPYNVGQVNENDNNKNRKYPTMDKRVAETYAKDSKATNKNALSDPYVKAIRWASDRIGEEGVVALVTNSGFLDGVASDGMRKHLAEDFDCIYILDLGGNVHKNPKLSGTTHNVFGIQVGVSVNFLVKKSDKTVSCSRIFYAHVDKFWHKEEKYRFLDERKQYDYVEWKTLSPNKRNTWLTEGLHAEFEDFVPIGSKEAKAAKGEPEEAIFKLYSRGVATCRDVWAYNFECNTLEENMRRMIDTYNKQVFMWEQNSLKGTSVDDFVVYDDKEISWSRDLKSKLKQGRLAVYDANKVRTSIYRPFSKSNLYFDRMMNDVVYVFPSIFPSKESEIENRVICLTDRGSEKPFMVLMSCHLTDLHAVGAGSSAQCFPFYTYDEDGSNRRETITDWSLAQFRAHYHDDSITKWDIFRYVYGLLHHPGYRERYQANLKRELPRILFAPDFRAFAAAGARLAQLHVGYEEQPVYPLTKVETPDMPLDWRVEKMRLSKDKTQLRYNSFLTLDGIPSEVFSYRLGNRSALEWVIDQYRVKTDKRSGIVNDPNRADDPQYILRLIGKVISVSLETVEIVAGLPILGAGGE